MSNVASGKFTEVSKAPRRFARVHSIEEIRRMWTLLQVLTAVAAADSAAIRQGIMDACYGVPDHSTQTSERVGRGSALPFFVVGFIALGAGPLLFALNLLVLAPIMELLVPAPGEPWFLPGVGPLQPIALVLATVLTLVELICAVTVLDAPSLALRIMAGFVLAAALCFETWGGYIRGGIGDPAGGEATLSAANPALVSALLSFLAPSGEAIAGCLAFRGVLLPLAMTALRLARLAHHRRAIRILRKRFGSFFEATFTDSEIGQAAASARTTVGEAILLAMKGEAVAASAERLTREAISLSGAAATAGAIQAALDRAEAAEAVRAAFVSRLETAELHRTLTHAKSPTLSHGKGDLSLGQVRDRFETQAKALENVVAAGAKAAYATAKAELDGLAGSPALSQGDPRARLNEEHSAFLSSIHELERLKAERVKAIVACRDTLAGEQFGRYFPASQEYNLTLVRKLVTDLDGEPPFVSPGGGAEGLETRRQEAVSALDERLRTALPAASPLARTGTALGHAKAMVERAEGALAAYESIPSVQARSRFRWCRDEIDLSFAGFMHGVEELRRALVERRAAEEALIAARRREASLYGRIRRWVSSRLARPILPTPDGDPAYAPASIRIL